MQDFIRLFVLVLSLNFEKMPGFIGLFALFFSGHFELFFSLNFRQMLDFIGFCVLFFTLIFRNLGLKEVGILNFFGKRWYLRSRERSLFGGFPEKDGISGRDILLRMGGT